MKKCKYLRAAVCIAASLAFLGCFRQLPWNLFTSYGMAISDEMMKKALEEEFGSMDGLDDLENLADDPYDMDIDQFTEEYFQKLERGEVSVEEFAGERIVNPKLVMTTTSDGLIRYTLPNGVYYDVTIPNGFVGSSPVTFYPSSEVIGVITKDGKSTSLFESWHFSEPGNYQVKLIFYEFDSEDGSDNKIYEVNHSFMITGRIVNDIGAVSAPEGFQITSIKKDGIPQPIENPGFAFLEGDGLFEIRYQDLMSGSVYAVTTFERDTTAPFLTFSKEIAGGPVEGPVEFYSTDVSDRVYLSYNGNTAETVSNVLTTAGKYNLKVVDEAGNSRLYQLEIRRTYHLFDKKLIILALIILFGAGVRFLLLRRDMKVI